MIDRGYFMNELLASNASSFGSFFTQNRPGGAHSNSSQEIKDMLSFLSLADNSKVVLRHSWAPIPSYNTSNLSASTKSHAEKMVHYRRESNAEHSWRLALMAMLWADKLEKPVDKERAIKIALVHDLGEALAGDIPVHQQDADTKNKKKIAESNAMDIMMAKLTPRKEDHMLYQFWLEYEDQKTAEAKFIKALDKLESFLKHNQDPIETWETHEMRMLYQDKWLRAFCSYDRFLSSACEQIIADGIEKVKAAGFDLETIKNEAYVEERAWQTIATVNNKK
jgi:putative hydrolase of HD superfamily